jgi:hypothetical protein
MSVHRVKGKPETSASSVLFGVAAILFLLGVAGWNTYGWDNLSWPQRSVMFSGAIYFALSLVAKKAPMHASLAGCGLFAVYLGAQAVGDLRSVSAGLIFKVPAIILLVYALVAARRERKSVPVAA